MSLFLCRVGTVEIEQAWADFCKSESTHHTDLVVYE
jgi:hypothetical protein